MHGIEQLGVFRVWAQSAHSDDFCVSRCNMQRGADKLQARRFKKKHASQAAEAIGWAGWKRRVAVRELISL